MSQHFHAIGEEQFDDVMADYDAERVDLERVKEIVYDIPTDIDGITVRVFSSIDTRGVGTKRARDSGNDAIRVLAYSHALDRPLAKASRTHRIETWESNLRPKIDAMIERVNADEFDTPDDELAALKSHDFDDADGENGAVYVAEVFTNDYDDVRVRLDGDTYDGKDAIKAPGWDTTHHDFDGDTKTWVVDADAIDEVHAELNEVGIALKAGDDQDDARDEITEVIRDATRGDYVTVTYEQKNGNGEAEKVGRVRSTDAGHNSVVSLTFNREDDGHTMHVQVRSDEVALLTAGSHHPYVGEVVDIKHVPSDPA